MRKKEELQLFALVHQNVESDHLHDRVSNSIFLAYSIKRLQMPPQDNVLLKCIHIRRVFAKRRTLKGR